MFFCQYGNTISQRLSDLSIGYHSIDYLEGISRKTQQQKELAIFMPLRNIGRSLLKLVNIPSRVIMAPIITHLRSYIEIKEGYKLNSLLPSIMILQLKPWQVSSLLLWRANSLSLAKVKHNNSSLNLNMMKNQASLSPFRVKNSLPRTRRSRREATSLKCLVRYQNI